MEELTVKYEVLDQRNQSLLLNGGLLSFVDMYASFISGKYADDLKYFPVCWLGYFHKHISSMNNHNPKEIILGHEWHSLQVLGQEECRWTNVLLYQNHSNRDQYYKGNWAHLQLAICWAKVKRIWWTYENNYVHTKPRHSILTTTSQHIPILTMYPIFGILEVIVNFPFYHVHVFQLLFSIILQVILRKLEEVSIIFLFSAFMKYVLFKRIIPFYKGRFKLFVYSLRNVLLFGGLVRQSSSRTDLVCQRWILNVIFFSVCD